MQRKPQHALVELVAQPAQHALPDLPLFDVDVELEPAVYQKQRKKHAAKREQIGNLIEFHAEKSLRKFLAGNSMVDDHLRQIKGVIEKRERNQSDNDEINLVSPTVMQDVPVDRRIEPVLSRVRKPALQKRGKQRPHRSRQTSGGTKKSHGSPSCPVHDAGI